MFKNLFSTKLFKQRGQVLVLYAVMIPLLFMFAGIGIDLGWYYLNVSRLQNAADAAALAGAHTIEANSDDTFGVHYYAQTLTARVPKDIELGVLDYEKISKEAVQLTELKNYKTAEEVKGTMIAGRDEVEKYTRLNVADDTAVQSPSKSTGKISAVDGWSTSSNANGKKIDGKVNLFIERTDLRNDIYGTMYYQVVLTEKVSHLFLKSLEPMNATVVAVVLLQPHGPDLLSGVRNLEPLKVIQNWEIQNYGYIHNNAPYTEKWNHFQRADQKIYYTDGDAVRREDITVSSNLHGKGTARTTSANGTKKTGKVFNDNELDSINIDYKQDINMSKTGYTKDWDLGVEELPVPSITPLNASGWNKDKAFDLRIHSNVDFDDPWKTRYPDSATPDVLWTRIESDPYYWNLGDIGKTMTQLNSVRQIFLNFNNSNAGRYPENSTEGVPGSYKYRPMFIFYTGPEKLEKSDTTKRVSQPLVLNFNTDFNAVVFAPNSPVLINGNGHTFKGFVIAKEFVQSKEEDDYKKFEDKDAYFELEGLNFMFTTDTMPENSTAVSLDYVNDDVKYYVAATGEITAINNSATPPEKKVEVTYSGGNSQYKYYVSPENLKCVKKDDDIPEGYVEISLTDTDKSKLTCYINEEDHFYKIVETSTVSCGDRDSSLVYDTPDHGNEKHENIFFVDWKGNLQTKPLGDDASRGRDDNEGIEDGTLIGNLDKEVVYYSYTFNLSNSSRYSSFEIESLQRKIYNYLDSGDSVDMFFTTERAGWID